MFIPVGRIATIRFTPLDNEGNPANLDGPLSFSLAAGSSEFVTLIPTEEDNVIDVRGDAPGEAQIVASGDVLLGDGTETTSWNCDVTVYNVAANLSCELIALRLPVDE